MKRICLLLFATIMLFSTALADGVELTAMTDDQLIELHTQIEEEMTNRNITGEHLYIGEYIAGEDIEPGRYVVSVVDAYDSAIGVYIQFDILNYNVQTGEWDRITFEDLDAIGQKASFTLKEGQKLTVSNGELEVLSLK